MAHEVNVNDGVEVAESPAAYEIGGGQISTIESTVLAAEAADNTEYTAFFANTSIGGSTGVYTIKAAPGAGSYLILTQISVICSDSVTLRIGSGESGGWVEKVIIGPLVFNTEVSGVGYKIGTQYTQSFKRPIRLPANKALTVDISATCSALVGAEGLVK
jgi:hypothetical protein